MSTNVNKNVNKNNGTYANEQGQRPNIPLRSALRRGGTGTNFGRDEAQAQTQTQTQGQVQGHEDPNDLPTLPTATTQTRPITKKRAVSFLTPSKREPANSGGKVVTRRVSSAASSSLPYGRPGQGRQATRKVRELVDKIEKSLESAGGMAGGRVAQPAALSTGDAGASSSAASENRAGDKGEGLQNVAGDLHKKIDDVLSKDQSTGAVASATKNATNITTTAATDYDDKDATPKPFNRSKAPGPSLVTSGNIGTSDVPPSVRAQTPAPETAPLSHMGLTAEQTRPSSQIASPGVKVTPLIKRMQPGTNTPQIIMPGLVRANDRQETDGCDTDNGGDTDVEDNKDHQTTPRPRPQLSRRSRSTSTMSIINASLPEIPALPMLSSQDPILDIPTSDLDVLAVENDDGYRQRRPRYEQSVHIWIEGDHPMPPSSPTPGRRDSPKISLFQLPPSSPPRELWSSPPPQSRRLGRKDEDYDCEGGDLPFSSKSQTISHALHLRMVEERLDARSSPPRQFLSGSSSDHVLPTPSSPIADRDYPITDYGVWHGSGDIDEDVEVADADAGAEAEIEVDEQPQQDSEMSDPSHESGNDNNENANANAAKEWSDSLDVMDESEPREADVTTTPKNPPPAYLQVDDIHPDWPLSSSPVIPRTTPPPAPSAQALSLMRVLENNPEMMMEAVGSSSTTIRPPTVSIPPVVGNIGMGRREMSPADVPMLSRASSVMDVEEELQEGNSIEMQDSADIAGSRNGGFEAYIQPQPPSSDCTMRDASPAPPTILPSFQSAFFGMHGNQSGEVPQMGMKPFGLTIGFLNTASAPSQSQPQPRNEPQSFVNVATTINAYDGHGMTRQNRLITNRETFHPYAPSFASASTNPLRLRFTSNSRSHSYRPLTTAANTDSAPSTVMSGHESYNRRDRAQHDQPQAQSYLAGFEPGFRPFLPPSIATPSLTTTTPVMFAPALASGPPPAAAPAFRSETITVPLLEETATTVVTRDSPSATATDTTIMPTTVGVISPNLRFTQSISRIAELHGTTAPDAAATTTATISFSPPISPSNDAPPDHDSTTPKSTTPPGSPPSFFAAETAKGDNLNSAHCAILGRTRRSTYPTSVFPTTSKSIHISLHTDVQDDPLSPSSSKLPPFWFRQPSLEHMAGELQQEWAESIRYEVDGAPTSGMGIVEVPITVSEKHMTRASEQLIGESEGERRRQKEDKASGERKEERRRVSEEEGDGARAAKRRNVSGSGQELKVMKKRAQIGEREKRKDRVVRVNREERRKKSTLNGSVQDSVEFQVSSENLTAVDDAPLDALLPMPGHLESESPMYRRAPASLASSASTSTTSIRRATISGPAPRNRSTTNALRRRSFPPPPPRIRPQPRQQSGFDSIVGSMTRWLLGW
ncbi:hypothetical protein AX16_006354 [Volvariella volvacea WC 439]|nr:hypothetical protein AX16_006354 [Volvariella volvacea WC 439]